MVPRGGQRPAHRDPDLHAAGAYIPAKRRAVLLEKELRALYAQEAELHTKVAQNENRQTLRDQQLIAVTRERDALARRLQELERELEAMRRR